MAFVVKDKVAEPLYAIVPYFNPWRWKSREKHILRALDHFHQAGAVIVLVEVAFNRREFTFADSGLHGMTAECGIHKGEFKHTYIGLRSDEELWLKENMINIAVSRALPYDWQQVCWLDADVHFVRPNWVGETIHKLQHYKFVQMFSEPRDLTPNYEMVPADYPHATGISFVKAWQEGLLEGTSIYYNGETKTAKGARNIWSGLAWAATRQAWDEVGGLIDFGLCGGGDWLMAHCLIEREQDMMHGGLHFGYQSRVYEWFHRCQEHIRRNVGVVEGTVLHNWHGSKKTRHYFDKHKMLVEAQFDPGHMLKRDFQGLYQLHDDHSENFITLRDGLRKLAKARNEDSIDL